MANPINKKIIDFLEYLEVDKGLSQATITNYAFYLRRFANFMQKRGISSIERLDKQLVHKYRVWLNSLKDKHGESLQRNTQNYHLIALRSWLKYLIVNDYKTLEPHRIELAKQEQRQVSFLEGLDLEAILKMPLHTKDEPIIKKRDKAILETFFATGLRVSELARLKIKDINLSKDEFTVRGKGKKVRLVFISKNARHWLQEYLQIRKDTNSYLFISYDRANKNSEAGLTARSIERIVQKYARLAGITKKVTPHTLRHSYATDLLMNGADIRSVQTMLGHSSITTTQVYTHITDKQSREAYHAFHGKQRKKR